MVGGGQLLGEDGVKAVAGACGHRQEQAERVHAGAAARRQQQGAAGDGSDGAAAQAALIRSPATHRAHTPIAAGAVPRAITVASAAPVRDTEERKAAW